MSGYIYNREGTTEKCNIGINVPGKDKFPGRVRSFLRVFHRFRHAVQFPEHFQQMLRHFFQPLAHYRVSRYHKDVAYCHVSLIQTKTLRDQTSGPIANHGGMVKASAANYPKSRVINRTRLTGSKRQYRKKGISTGYTMFLEQCEFGCSM